MLFFSLQQQMFISPAQDSQCQCGHSSDNLCFTWIDYVSFGIVPIFPYRLRRNKACLTCQKQWLSKGSAEPFSWWKVAFKCKGLVVLFIALMLGYMHFKADKARQMALLQSPQVHDFYLIDYSLFRNESFYQKQFLVAKVVAVDHSKVSILLANYRYQRQNQVIKAIKLDNLIKSDYFSTEREFVSRDTLSELLEQGAIYQVLRAEGLTLFGGIVEMPSRPEPLYKGFKQNKANQEGLYLYQEGLFEDALVKFTEAAEQGDMHGQANLADMYRDGQGVAVDLSQALYWFQQAAAQGHQKAQIQVTKLCDEHALCGSL